MSLSFPVLVLPGLSSSGPTHWQTLWEQQFPEWTRVEQSDWFDPDPSHWTSTIEAHVGQCATPPLLIAHSLATIAVALWASQTRQRVRGAFLVAPADVESPSPHTELLLAFRPICRKPLPFPSLVVGSCNDPYGDLERVRGFAQSWGSQFVLAGALGHINANSGIADWPQGLELLHSFAQTLN